MSLFKGKLDSGNKFTAQDDVRGLELLSPTTDCSYLGLETGDSVKWYMWFDNSDNLRKHTTAPTASTLTSGSVVSGATSDQASPQLDNLGTTAINADLLPVTATYDLGGASNVWAEGFVTKMVLYPTDCYFTGTSAVATLTGALVVGTNAGAAAHDVTFHGYTANQYIKWDENYNTNAGGLMVMDNVAIAFGSSQDFVIDCSSTPELIIEPAAGNTVVRSGAAANLDWVWESQSVAGDDMAWDASTAMLHLADGASMFIGGAAALTQDDGFEITFDKDNTLNIDPITVNDAVRIGETVTADLYLDGIATDMQWDASVNELLLHDSTKLVFGGSAGAGADDLIITSNGTLVNMTFGATTNSIVLAAYAAQTAAALHIDGATNDWDGATGVGMLHISGDSALIHANASLLQVVQATAKPINSARGFVARFIDTAANVTTDPAYAVEINSTNNFGLNLVTGHAAVSNLVLSGATAQTASMIIVDGTTTAGWDGADVTGMVHLKDLSAHIHAGASALFIDVGAAPISAAKGAGLRVVQTAGAAVTNGYLVDIAATTTGGALHVDTGIVVFDESLAVGTTLAVTGASTFTAAGTFTAGQQSSAVALTAVATNGVATPAGTTFVDVTSTAAANIVDLPTPVLGNVVYYSESSAVGYELAPQADTQYINNTLCSSAKELAVAAGELITAICYVGGAAGKWYVTQTPNTGTPTGAGTPD